MFLKGEDVSTWEFDELCWDAVFVEAREDGGGLGGFLIPHHQNWDQGPAWTLNFKL